MWCALATVVLHAGSAQHGPPPDHGVRSLRVGLQERMHTGWPDVWTILQDALAAVAMLTGHTQQMHMPGIRLADFAWHILTTALGLIVLMMIFWL